MHGAGTPELRTPKLDRLTGELPGRSFAPLLRGEERNREDEAIVILDAYGPNRMLRTREWKYVERYPGGPNELYHLAAARGERVNLFDAPAHAAVQDRMRSRLQQWYAQHACAARDGKALYDCRGRGQRGRADGAGARQHVFAPRN